MIKDIESILVSTEEIDEITSRIAEQITNDYKDSEKKLVLICILKGSLMFTCELMKRIERVHEAERRNFFKYFKQANWSGMDKTYGSLMARAKTAKMLLDSYLAGEIDKIDSLEEKRLHRALNGFLSYKVISSHTP